MKDKDTKILEEAYKQINEGVYEFDDILNSITARELFKILSKYLDNDVVHKIDKALVMAKHELDKLKFN